MLLAIIDTETTGVQPLADQLIEVACILYRVGQLIEVDCTLYRVEHGPIACASTLLPVTSNPAQAINGISPEMTRGIEPRLALELIGNFMLKADYCVAHNAEFDRAFLRNHPIYSNTNTPWLCTYEDFQWQCKGRSLSDIALHYGLVVDGSQNHRALYDCQLIARIFDAVGDRLPKMIEVAAQPRFLYEAIVGYDDRELAKVAGFRWDGGAKKWLKKMTEAEAEALNFKTLIV